MKGKKLDHKSQFFAVLLLSTLIAQVPVLGWPLMWLVTYFYEISQCFTASLTGGYIGGLTLQWNGTGQCTSTNGISWLKALMGFPGMAMFGVLCYFTVGAIHPKKAMAAILVLLLVILASLFLFSRSFAGGIILSLLAMLVACLFIWRRKFILRVVLKILAFSLAAQSVALPFFVLKNPYAHSDVMLLSQLSHLPTMLFCFIWICFGVFVLQYLWIYHRWRGW